MQFRQLLNTLRIILTWHILAVYFNGKVPNTDDIFKIQSTLLAISYKNEVNKTILKGIQHLSI